jgi:chloramphenicol 3-O phosphotransferase
MSGMSDLGAGGPPGAQGTVLVLNGPSSSGKSSLARALQARWPGPLLDAGLDRHLGMLPGDYLGPLWPEVYRCTYALDGTITAVTVGPVGARLHRGMHRAVAALARSGCDVVVDHVLLERRWALDLVRALEGVPTVLVGVRLPAAVLAQRERGRADRTLGQALAQLPAVHSHGGYDVDVDTSVLDADAAADRVRSWLAGGGSPTAAARWRRDLTG